MLFIQHPCLRVPNSSVELAQKGDLVLADGADKAQSASDRPQTGMHCIPVFRVLNSKSNRKIRKTEDQKNA